jgi:hypothetical protein
MVPTLGEEVTPSAAEGKFTLTPNPSPAGRGEVLAKDRRVFLHPSPSGRGVGVRETCSSVAPAIGPPPHVVSLS